MNAPNLLVSIVIPAHNAQATLARAIRSALDQDYPSKEIIVVDDGSTDGTATVAGSFGGAIRYIRQANSGAAAARNRGIAESRGEFIAFLDADDEWLPSHLTAGISPMLQDATVGLTYCYALYRRLDGRDEIYNESAARQYVFLRTLWPPPLQCTPATICRRAVLNHVGVFDQDLKAWEDQDLWIRCGEVAGVFEIPEVFVKVYETGKGQSVRTDFDRVKADYFRVIQRAFARQPERYEPQRRSIYAEADYFWGVRHYARGEHAQARRHFVESLRNHWTPRTLRFILQTLPPPALMATLRRFRKGGS